mgnify:CR=1 FL=1
MPKSAELRLEKIKKFLVYIRENRDDFAAKELEEVLEDIVEDQKYFVTKSEIRELIIEMREGFKAMDKRFNDLIHYVDKRFEEILHQMDKRFEAVDKRFEEILHYMDKRFEAVDKRFEDMNKRFEDMNARMNFLQWLMAFFMSLLFGVLTFFNYKQMDLLNKILESNQQIQAELKNK